MWLGYNQSLRPAEVGITLNIDMAATAFLEVQKLMDYISRVLGIRPNQLASADPRLIKKASKAITGIKVAALHGKRTCCRPCVQLFSALVCTHRHRHTYEQRLIIHLTFQGGKNLPL